MRKALLPLLLIALISPALAAPMRISTGAKATPLEQLAAKELQRYLYQISGQLLPIGTQPSSGFVVGTPESNPAVAKLAPGLKALGEEGYLLKRDGDRLLIAANAPRGVLYGVYGLLEEYGVGFSLGGDALPRRRALSLPNLDKTSKPALKVRGVLPWYNFFDSPTAWNAEDYRQFADNLARMKMNFLGFHVYEHEPFTAYEWDKKLVSGEPLVTSMQPCWGTTPMKTSEYGFGTDRYFDAPLFAADSALGNATREEGIARSKAALRDALTYAKGRGIKTCVGFEVIGDPTAPGNRDRLEARLRQLLSDYPMLDYVWIWESEALGIRGTDTPDPKSALAAYCRRDAGKFAEIKDMRRVAEAVRVAVYTKYAHDILERISPQTRLVVSGWGGDHHLHFSDFFPGFDKILPRDVIFSALDDITTTPQISAAYAKVKKHETWPIPWFEFDGDQWHPQPKLIAMEALSKQAYTAGCQGMLGIHWRTRGVDEAAGYLARVAWEPNLTRERFCTDWARAKYGPASADAMGKIHLALDDLGYRWIGGSGQPECGTFSWGPSIDTAKAAKLAALGDEVDQQIGAMQAAGDLGAADRARYLRRTIDWVIAYEKAALALDPRSEAATKLAAAEKAKGDEAIRLANEADRALHDSGLDRALQILATNVTNRGELGVLATVNMKAYANYRARLQKIRKILGETAGLKEPGYAKVLSAPEVRVISRADVVRPGEAIRVRALAIDADNPTLALRYRQMGTENYQSAPMRPLAGNWFEATIPEEQLGESGVEYYVSLDDPTGARAFAPAAFPGETFTAIAWQEPTVPAWQPAPSPKTPIAAVPVTEVAADGWHASLRWLPAPGAASYRLTRDPGTARERVVQVPDNWYEDRDVVPEARYTYRVTPIAEDGTAGAASKPKLVTIPKPSTLRAPSSLLAQPGPGRVVLTWDQDGFWGLAGSKVTRIAPNGKAVLLTKTPIASGITNTNRFVDRPTGAGPYRYSVQQAWPNGIESPAAEVGPVAALAGKPEPFLRAKLSPDGKLATTERAGDGYFPLAARATGEGWSSYPSSPAMSPAAGLTIALRVKLDNTEGMPVLLCHGAWEQDGYFLQILNGQLRFNVHGVGTIDVGWVPVGRWVNLAATLNGTRMEGYIDGQSVGGNNLAGEPIPSKRDLFIGRYDADEPVYLTHGTISSVALYPYGLEPDEIKALAGE